MGVKFSNRKYALLYVPGSPSFTLFMQNSPPQKHFSEEFSELFYAFMQAVPCPDMTRLENLAAHFPMDGIVPDSNPFHPHIASHNC